MDRDLRECVCVCVCLSVCLCVCVCVCQYIVISMCTQTTIIMHICIYVCRPCLGNVQLVLETIVTNEPYPKPQIQKSKP